MAINAKETAMAIKAMADKLGWSINVRGSILTIKKHITAGSTESFCQADMEYYSILGLLPSTSAGSIWGTDGGGVRHRQRNGGAGDSVVDDRRVERGLEQFDGVLGRFCPVGRQDHLRRR